MQEGQWQISGLQELVMAFFSLHLFAIKHIQSLQNRGLLLSEERRQMCFIACIFFRGLELFQFSRLLCKKNTGHRSIPAFYKSDSVLVGLPFYPSNWKSTFIEDRCTVLSKVLLVYISISFFSKTNFPSSEWNVPGEMPAGLPIFFC